jgi:hypothetical protein
VDQAEQIGRSIPELNRTAHRQRGWVGILVLLIALVIVAVLAQTVLKSYGMLGAGAPLKAQSRVPGPAAPAAQDATAAPATPTTPIERARGVEQTLKQGAEDMSKRIDEQTK